MSYLQEDHDVAPGHPRHQVVRSDLVDVVAENGHHHPSGGVACIGPGLVVRRMVHVHDELNRVPQL